MSTLDEIRKKLQAQESQKGGQSNFGGDKVTYPHWNIPEGTQATLRLVPDGDESNTFFWVERQLINLSFPGIIGHDEHKEITIKVPCVEMWSGKNTCPILNEVRPMWKDKSLEDIARKYWIKKTYFAQGFVKSDPMGEQDSPENPIRKFIIGPQLFKIIQAALLDPDMENNPVDYINGTDFVVTKSSKGGYADYGTSKWARKESSLTTDQMDAIEKYGLVNLSDYLPKRPTQDHLTAMYEMFQASIDGELYDPARWSKYYKPFGFDSGHDDAEGGEGKRVFAPRQSVAQTRASANPIISNPLPVNSITEDEVAAAESGYTAEPVSTTVTPTPVSTGATKSPQEILALLRSRSK